MSYTLGYWKIRGLAAPIRMAFAYSGKELNQDVYADPDVWAAKYEEMKQSHPFPNLPYLITPSGATIVQSNAIIRHVGRALGLLGDTANELELTRVDELLEQVNDLRVEAVNNYYAEKIAADFVTGTIPYYLEVLDKHLNTALEGKSAVGGPFFFGAKPTIVDFMAYEIVRTPLPLIAEKRAEYEAAHPRIFALLKAVEALPELEAYFGSEYYKLSANAPVANFGGEPEQ